MGKLKNPVLALGAKGTIADTLTYQRSRRTNIVRRKPVPAYRRSLKQMYQRWLYQDYIARWNTLTASEKAAYRTAASRNHTTPLAEYLRVQLSTLPDISALWHLDHITGGTTPDSSKESNTGIVTGCSVIDGLIDKALYFDGINDFVACGNDDSLHHTGEFTYICRVYNETFPAESYYMHHRHAGAGALIFFRQMAGKPAVRMSNNGAVDLITYSYSTSMTAKTWHLVAITRNATDQIHLWLDAVPELAGVIPGTLSDFTLDLFLGRSHAIYWHHGRIDEAVVFQRALTQSDQERMLERSWP